MMPPPSPLSPAPAWQTDTLTTPDGSKLRYGVYRHENAPPPQRAIIFMNGRGEYLEKYDELPHDLHLPADVWFVSWDHRGQGASSGSRSYMDHYDTYARDAAAIAGRALPPGTPYVIIAHSMGALIALYATMSGRLNPEQLILTSPLLGLPKQPVAPWLARLISHVAVGFGYGQRHIDKKARPLPDFSTNPLTHSEEKFARMLAAPYPGSSVTFGWVKASMAAIGRVFAPRWIANLQVPVTILLAEKETVVDNKKAYAWLALAKVYSLGPVHHHVIKEAKHELFSELAPAYDECLTLIRQILADWQSNGSGPAV